MEVLQGGLDARLCLGVETQTASHSLAGPRHSSLLEQSNSKQTVIRCGRCLELTANLTRHWRQSLMRVVCSRWQEREAANVVLCGYIHAKQRWCRAMAGSDLSLTTYHLALQTARGYLVNSPLNVTAPMASLLLVTSTVTACCCTSRRGPLLLPHLSCVLCNLS